MSFIPLWINPLTDLSNILTPKLFLTSKKNLCAELFLKYIDCIEAYGTTKGTRECAAILFDSMECTQHTFQVIILYIPKKYFFVSKQNTSNFKSLFS